MLAKVKLTTLTRFSNTDFGTSNLPSPACLYYITLETMEPTQQRQQSQYQQIPEGQLASSSPRHLVTVQNNNQDTILMCLHANDKWNFLHDNRVYAFKKQSDEPTNVSDQDVKEGGQNLMLTLLTTPKFRAMNAMYKAFRLLDNMTFVFLLGLAITSLINGDGDFELKRPTEEQLALYSVFGLELLYDILMFAHMYWFLQRLSIYIGLMLYVFYFGVVLVTYTRGKYDLHDFHVVLVALTIRFGAFVLEECVDIAMDNELHNDLCETWGKSKDMEGGGQGQDETPLLRPDAEKQLTNPSLSSWSRVCALFRRLKLASFLAKYLDNSAQCKLPPFVEYVGSFSAGLPVSAFNDDAMRTKTFSRLSFWLLCAAPFVLALCVGLFICVVLLPAVLLAGLVGLCFGCIANWRNKLGLKTNFQAFLHSDFLKELLHF